jgi:signal transduction histidine kinase
LRIRPTESIASQVHARVVYAVAAGFLAMQVFNWVHLYFLLGGFHFQHVLSVGVCLVLILLSFSLRITRSRVFFGSVYGALMLGGVGLSAINETVPFMEGGINTSLISLLAVGPIIVAMVSSWRGVVVYTVCAMGLLASLKYHSVIHHDLVGAELLAAIPAGGEVSVGATLQTIYDGRFFQTSLSVIVAALVAAPMGHQLYQILDRFEAALRASRQAEAAKGDFLAQMSHEIRTPLNGIIAMSDMLCAGDLPERAGQQAVIVKNAGQQLMEIVDDVLDHARLESGRLDIHPEPFDLRETLQDVVKLHGVSAQNRGLWLGLDWQQGLPSVLVGDQKRLRQVVTNFVSNALKFTEVGGVRIGVRGAQINTSLGSSVKLQIFVQDTGQGISEAMQAKVFERFVQSKSGSRQGNKGTGLGLAITKQLAELMGGTVAVSSTPGQGSVFVCHIELPVMSAVAPAEMGTSEAA